MWWSDSRRNGRTQRSGGGQGVRGLTASQGPHLGVLRVHLADVSHASTQDVGVDLVAKLVLPLPCLHAGAVHLGTAVRWGGETQMSLFVLTT